MCSSAHRYPGDRQLEHQAPSASPQSARGVRRKDCKPECRAADAGSFSIRACCPGSHHENHVADQITQRGERDPRCAAREHVMRARALPKPMPDEVTRRLAHREIVPAKVCPNDRVAVEQTCVWFVPHASNSREADQSPRVRCYDEAPPAPELTSRDGTRDPPRRRNPRSEIAAIIPINVITAHSFANNSPCRV